jgi:uncharacterized protein (TIGR02246 family)
MSPGTPSESQSIRGIIETSNTRWNEAFNRSDAAALATLYAPDGKLLPPTNQVIAGPAAITEFWQTLFDHGFCEHTIEIVEIHTSGDLAYEAGKWRAASVGKDGSKKQHQGNLVHVFERQSDGSWKSRLHSWN